MFTAIPCFRMCKIHVDDSTHTNKKFAFLPMPMISGYHARSHGIYITPCDRRPEKPRNNCQVKRGEIAPRFPSAHIKINHMDVHVLSFLRNCLRTTVSQHKTEILATSTLWIKKSDLS